MTPLKHAIVSLIAGMILAWLTYATISKMIEAVQYDGAQPVQVETDVGTSTMAPEKYKRQVLVESGLMLCLEAWALAYLVGRARRNRKR